MGRLGPEVDAELLSMHFLHAQRYDEAWHHARVAGNRARDRYANVEAEVLFERALAAARRMPHLEGAEVASVWESLGDVRERAGRYDRATRAYREARRLVRGQPVTEAGLCLKEAWLPERRGRHAEAVRWIRRGLGVLEGRPGAEAAGVRAQLSVWYAAVRQIQGRHHEAVTWCERTVTEARRSGERGAEAHALFILDWAWVSLGRFDLATHSERALALYVELGDLGGEAVVLNNLGGFAYFRGQWDEAVTYYERGRDARLRTGDDIEAATGTCNIGEVLADQGHHDEAESCLLDALRVWRAARYRPGIGYARSLMGRLAARRGRFVEAHEQFEAAKAEYAAVGIAGDARTVDAWIAECLVLEGRAGPALAAVDAIEHDAGAEWAETGERALLERVRGLAFAQLGDTDAARGALTMSLAAGEERAADYEVALTQGALARVARLEGDAVGATRLEKQSDATLRRLGVKSVPVVPDHPERDSVDGAAR